MSEPPKKWEEALPEGEHQIAVKYGPQRSSLSPSLSWSVVVRGEEKHQFKLELSDEMMGREKALEHMMEEIERNLHNAILKCVKNDMIENNGN